MENLQYESRISHIPLNQISNIIQYKLKDDNLLTWKSLTLPLLKRYKVSGFLDGSTPCPTKFLTQAYLDQGNVNPSYTSWCDDNTLFLWLESTISGSVVAYVVGADSARELWINIESRFGRTSVTHVIQIRTQLQSFILGSGTMYTYLGDVKRLLDQLDASGSEISNDELVVLILTIIGQEYNSFSTSIRTPVTFDELHNMLLSEEIVVKERSKSLLF